MRFKLFSIYDSKAEAHLPPFSFAATGMAVRAFADMANDPQHQVGRHPEDYTLFELGTFDDEHALVEMYPAKQSLGNALEYCTNEPSPDQIPLKGVR